MECPTKEQILKAARSSKEARKALTLLFPEVFDRKINFGEFYEWGTDSSGGSGLVVDMGRSYSFVNFQTGLFYLHDLPIGTTMLELNYKLGKLPSGSLFNCYEGEIRGPKRLRSWCMK